MNNDRYMIEIPDFSKLRENEVGIAVFNEVGKTFFKVLVYPQEEEHISLKIRRYLHYPPRIAGLVEDSLSFTVSIVDAEGMGRFPRSFGVANFFSLDWLVDLNLTNVSGDSERLVSRRFLLDQSDEFLLEDVLKIRVEVSYQASGHPADAKEVVKQSEVAREADIERLEFIDLIEESLFEIREFVFLYQDLHNLQEMLGSHPDYEGLTKLIEKSGDTEKFRALFRDFRDCFRLNRSLLKHAALPYTEHKNEEEVKKIQHRLWLKFIRYNQDIVRTLIIQKDSFEVLIEGRRNVLYREKEWQKRLELIEARMQVFVRLLDLNGKLKEYFQNRRWFNREAEEKLRKNEKEMRGDKHPARCMEENLLEMLAIHQSLQNSSVEHDFLITEKSAFSVLFLSTVDVLAHHVFDISEVFIDWTQSLIERNLSLDPGKAAENERNPSESIDVDQRTEITIETEMEEIPVPDKAKLLECSPVFRQMLHHPFKEAFEGRIAMKHFDSATVRDFLSFLNCGTVREDMDSDDGLSLYLFAHMYQVRSLEEKLADHLYGTLSSQKVDVVSEYYKRLGDDHPLQKALGRLIPELVRTMGEPEYSKGLKEWARKQRMLCEADDSFNFYQ